MARAYTGRLVRGMAGADVVSLDEVERILI